MNARDPKPTAMNRRRFVHVVAASVAAILAGGVPRARAAAAPRAAAPKPPKPLPAALQRELRTQEKSLADVLKVVRAYDLPPGSEPATLFRALRARRGVR
ncbi:MAG TPA: hypothetical protein VFS09_05565 [Candidatus Eisenbacteria bacterium]|nr:hypothetical protein [Candidatus Eisenbacteria bacterium]